MSGTKRRIRKLPKYCTEECDERGTCYIYFRRPGQRKVRLTGSPWSPEFMAQYADAMKAHAARIGAPTVAQPALSRPGTWRWLCERYFG